MKKSEVDIIAEAIESHLREEWHQVFVNGKLDSSHANIHDAQKRMSKLRELKSKDKLEIVQKKYMQEATHIHKRPDGTTLVTKDGDKDQLRGYILRTPAIGHIQGFSRGDSHQLPDDDKTEYHTYAVHSNQKDQTKLGSFKKHHHAVDAIEKFHKDLELN